MARYHGKGFTPRSLRLVNRAILEHVRREDLVLRRRFARRFAFILLEELRRHTPRLTGRTARGWRTQVVTRSGEFWVEAWNYVRLRGGRGFGWAYTWKWLAYSPRSPHRGFVERALDAALRRALWR